MNDCDLQMYCTMGSRVLNPWAQLSESENYFSFRVIERVMYQDLWERIQNAYLRMYICLSRLTNKYGFVYTHSVYRYIR